MEVDFSLCGRYIVYIICLVPHVMELLLYGPGYVHAVNVAPKVQMV